MRSDLTPLFARWIGETPNLKNAMLVPLAAQGAALNLLTLERAWCDERGWFK